ncbi:hypothetical protein QLG13_16745 [Rhodococcus aetherivorans]|uniref:hypothetical protein n=1 Tax=Rhodococcus aetherivorans TaxID=191292 RepID=UPI0002D230AA|nr:hypothetical protein [Rhodococcus aetherivorans]CCW14152.1 hypothetical protein EBESD8_47200 [Rhodococcus aetherivorans]
MTGDPGVGLRGMIVRHRVAFGLLLTLASSAFAVLWLFVVPARADETTGVQSAAIRHAHPACWMLLAAASALFATRAPRRAVDAVAWSALVAYAVFVVATLA